MTLHSIAEFKCEFIWVEKCKQNTSCCSFINVTKAAFPRAKFLCHISHALQSLLTYVCGIIAVNLYSRTDTDEKWINNSYNFGINDCRACNLWQRKFGRVLEASINPYLCRLYFISSSCGSILLAMIKITILSVLES